MAFDKKKYQKEYRSKNKAQRKEYRLKNAEKIKAQRKEYRLKNAEKIEEYNKKNPEKIKRNSKKHYLKNAEVMRKSNRENQQKLPDFAVRRTIKVRYKIIPSLEQIMIERIKILTNRAARQKFSDNETNELLIKAINKLKQWRKKNG